MTCYLDFLRKANVGTLQPFFPVFFYLCNMCIYKKYSHTLHQLCSLFVSGNKILWSSLHTSRDVCSFNVAHTLLLYDSTVIYLNISSVIDGLYLVFGYYKYGLGKYSCRYIFTGVWLVPQVIKKEFEVHRTYTFLRVGMLETVLSSRKVLVP